MSFNKDHYEILLYLDFYILLIDDHYTRKINLIMNFNKDHYEILLYFNFYISLIDVSRLIELLDTTKKSYSIQVKFMC